MRRWTIALLVLLIVGAAVTSVATLYQPQEQATTGNFIVQAASLEEARTAVIEAGGRVTHELDIIDAVGATLTDRQLEALRTQNDVKRVYEDRTVDTSATLTALSSASCSLSADEYLGFDANRVFWRVANTSGAALKLDRMMVMWPRRNGALRAIGFNGRNVYQGRVKGAAASFDAMELLGRDDDDDSDSDRQFLTDSITIGVGEMLEVAIEFDRVIRSEDSYEVRLFFAGGCSVDFPVAPRYAFRGDSDTAAKRTYVASLTGADALHWKGVTGEGVGVAVIDTGIWTSDKESLYLLADAHGRERVIAQYDAIKDKFQSKKLHSDKNGHGSHVTSVIASSRFKDSESNGIAPGVNLTLIKAFDDEGVGSYLDVIRGLDWVLKYKDKLGIRVLNLSFSATPQSYYWDDPLNQAVMKAWQNGIVVVASAGNKGPSPMTIGVPGNLPYVITVGAITDSVTPLDWSDDRLASFSSAGPTYEGFVKPDVVAPGGHVRGLMGKKSKLASKHPHYHDGDAYFTMSGTSQSTAIVSGAVALLLQAEPWLVPDQVKCKLVSSARAARRDDGAAAYSVFQQGAGLIDITAALGGREYDCANIGLDVAADLAGKAHFQGHATQDTDGAYYLRNSPGNGWDGSTNFDGGYVWGGGMAWNDGMPWSDAEVFGDGMPWNDGKVFNSGMPWNDVHKSSVSVGAWEKQE